MAQYSLLLQFVILCLLLKLYENQKVALTCH